MFQIGTGVPQIITVPEYVLTTTWIGMAITALTSHITKSLVRSLVASTMEVLLDVTHLPLPATDKK